jgi:hypothetical protein
MHIAPNLGGEWFFDAARLYWETFRPTVLPNFDFLALIPAERAITVTVIARRDLLPQLGVDLAQIVPLAYLDAVVYDTFEATRDELNRRAAQQQPFGVPLSDSIMIPTPMGTPAAGTPTPTDVTITQIPVTQAPILPITPTPGPLVP